MPTLVRYATRLFFVHVGLMLMGFVALLQLLDILSNADDVLSDHGEDMTALLRYAWLRLPESVVFMMPFSVLMGSLLAVARLAQNNEVLALKAAGLSFYKLLLAFVPAALVAAGLYFVFSDRLAPASNRALAEWNAAAAADRAAVEVASEEGIWVRDGDVLVRVGIVTDEGRELRGVTLFLRDDQGNMTERLTARAASYDGESWRLFGVERLDLVDGSGGTFTRFAEHPWRTALTPGHFSDLATPPSGLSLSELIDFATNPDVGNRPTYYYETWVQKRITLPIAVLIMLLLAAPVAQGLQRHGGVAGGLMAGLGLGFLYFVADGFVLALGEAGAIPPALAAWSPPLMFASLGGAALIRFEGY
ncbi:MAG: LPS export ABC transporter permease LptG [Alphaproteobacteria bacterium]|nr:MAG: LPS export ABC transporter permease LptG [Alphaproteobacteria bacterium]